MKKPMMFKKENDEEDIELFNDRFDDSFVD